MNSKPRARLGDIKAPLEPNKTTIGNGSLKTPFACEAGRRAVPVDPKRTFLAASAKPVDFSYKILKTANFSAGFGVVGVKYVDCRTKSFC